MLNTDDETRNDTELEITGDKPIYNASIQEIGGSKYMLIPVDAQTHLELAKTDPASLQVMIEDGPHGPYMSVWNSKQQSEEDRKGEDK